MNPHAARLISPFILLNTFKTHRNLIYNLVKRQVIGRYRGSVMGLLWSFFNPVLIPAVYTFVFSVIFDVRWAEGADSKIEFTLVLFAGVMVYNLFAGGINRAPGLVPGNVDYVKKAVFPLEILSVVAIGSAIFHFLISLFVWLIFYLIFLGVPHATLLLFPLVLMPFFLLILGFAWLQRTRTGFANVL